MPLFALSKEELVVSVIEDLSQNTSLTKLSSGSFVRNIVESVMARIAEAYEIFDLNLARGFVTAAQGEFLDLFGDLFGISRESSKAASVEAASKVIRFYSDTTFGNINSGGPIYLTEGTIISTEQDGEGTLYRLIDDYILPASESSLYVAAEALIPGEDSNIGRGELLHHSFTTYTDYINNSLKVINDYQIANGSSLESDDNFKFRIINRTLEAEAGNTTAIRLAVLSTPGVANATIIPRFKGLGTFGVLVKSVTSTVTDGLLALITENVSQVQGIGTVGYITGPKEIGLTFNITVHYSQRLQEEQYLEIERILEDTIFDFVNGLDIGEDFNSNKLVAQLFGVDERITNFGIPGKPIDQIYVWKQTKLADNKIRQTLLGDYLAKEDERVIIEPSVSSFVTFTRAFSRR